MTNSLPPLQSPRAQHIQTAFDLQMKHYLRVGETSSRERRKKLKSLEKWILSHLKDIRDAVHSDFGKPPFEVDTSESFVVISEIRHARRHLKAWMRDTPVRTPLALIGTRSWIRRESRGVNLIIAPWNFPFNLAMGPLVSAIAAGNCVILKPSERTPATAALIERCIRALFPPEEVTVVQGGIPESQDLLRLPFHHIFFTGSPQVGKIVMRAASENLTPVTLELGGKNPSIVDASAALKATCRRIAWGKFYNAGQACVAPDFVLVEAAVMDRFVEVLQETIDTFFAGGIETGSNYARMVDERHATQVAALHNDPGLRNGDVIPPTIVVNPPADSPLLAEEIFGPILPVIAWRDEQELMQRLQSMERPLSLYVFSRKRRFVERILSATRSGGVGINATVVQFFNNNLPFGGVNHSGFGKSHGWFGFETFSNSRAHIKATLPVNYNTIMRPPYTGWRKRIVAFIIRYL